MLRTAAGRVIRLTTAQISSSQAVTALRLEPKRLLGAAAHAHASDHHAEEIIIPAYPKTTPVKDSLGLPSPLPRHEGPTIFGFKPLADPPEKTYFVRPPMTWAHGEEQVAQAKKYAKEVLREIDAIKPALGMEALGDLSLMEDDCQRILEYKWQPVSERPYYWLTSRLRRTVPVTLSDEERQAHLATLSTDEGRHQAEKQALQELREVHPKKTDFTQAEIAKHIAGWFRSAETPRATGERLAGNLPADQRAGAAAAVANAAQLLQYAHVCMARAERIFKEEGKEARWMSKGWYVIGALVAASIYDFVRSETRSLLLPAAAQGTKTQEMIRNFHDSQGFTTRFLYMFWDFLCVPFTIVHMTQHAFRNTVYSYAGPYDSDRLEKRTISLPQGDVTVYVERSRPHADGGVTPFSARFVPANTKRTDGETNAIRGDDVEIYENEFYIIPRGSKGETRPWALTPTFPTAPQGSTEDENAAIADMLKGITPGEQAIMIGRVRWPDLFKIHGTPIRKWEKQYDERAKAEAAQNAPFELRAANALA